MMPELQEELTFDQARDCLALLSKASGEWAGIPCPVEGERLYVHPRYPYANCFNPPDGADASQDDARIFTSRRLQATVAIFFHQGRYRFITAPWAKPVYLQLRTLAACIAWDPEAEARAQKMLQGLLTPHAFNCYQTTGAFLETSKHSRVTYMFRRLRPTLAFSANGGERAIPLCALCMHPIGYYEDSFAGAMVPTDDVIAHLLLMRADEHLFWKKSNQHPLWHPASGASG